MEWIFSYFGTFSSFNEACFLFLPKLSVMDFVHGIVYPRLVTFSADPVFLLWSRDRSDNRPGAWYEPNHFVPLYSVKANGCGGIDEASREESTAKPFNETCQSNSAKGSKQTEEWGDFKKNATVSGEIHKKNLKKGEKGTNKATKRGSLEQFGFRSQSSSAKKIKKEEKHNSHSTFHEEKKAETETITPAEVDSNSADRLEKKKPTTYEEKRVRKFQWNWLTLFPWLRINMQCLSSNEQYPYPYPQAQPPNCEVSSMYCDVCSRLSISLSSSGADISKKSGSKVFKIESLKKHEKSQAHASCVEALNARQKPQETPLLNL